MDPLTAIKIIQALAQLSATVAPHIKGVLADMSETDAAKLKSDLAVLQELNDAAYGRVIGKLDAAAKLG